MRAITPVYANPFGIFNELEKELNGLVLKRREGGFDNRFAFKGVASKETEQAWLMAFDLPGVKSEDLSVEFEEGALRIEGLRKDHFGDGEGTRFSRSIQVPESVDVEGITASMEDGVLSLTLPKATKEKPKKIEIKTH